MVARSSANFLIFCGHAGQRGSGFCPLAQTLGRTAIPFIKKYIVSAAKIFGADLFEIAAAEIREVVSGRKNSQYLQKKLVQKNSSKTVGRWKKEIQA